MAAVNSIIETRNLCFSFGEKEILKNISIRIPENKFTVVLGRNGSGKSTLLRLISGLFSNYKGTILIDGKDMKKYASKERAGLVGFLPQTHNAVFPFLVREVVLTGRAASVGLVPGKEDHTVARKSMEMVGISQLADRVYSELSGGEQQLVMIARVLTQQPKILILDEPISHLDYRNQLLLIRFLKQLVADGMTVISVIHDPNFALFSGDHFVLMQEGKAEISDPENLYEHQFFKEIIQGDLHRIRFQDRFIFVPGF